MSEYIILDIETTGLDITHSSVIEIGAILVAKGVVRREFHSFVKHADPLPSQIKKLTGIAEEDLRNAPELAVVLNKLREFIGKCPVVAHNGFKFDFPLLENSGLKFYEKYDSLEFAFFILPTCEVGHSVSALAKLFALGDVPHRAIEDCKLELQIILQLQEEYKKRPKGKAKALKAHAERIGWWWAEMLPGTSDPADHLSLFAEKHIPYRKKNAQQDQLGLGTQPIEFSDVESYFLGVGSSGDYSEDRPEQRAMAALIAESFNECKHLVIEAGTGTGKSKAYLVPSLLFALKNAIPVIVATNTKALQDQLYQKEIQHLREKIKPDLRVAVLKGKKNYICLKKFEEFVDDVFSELSQRSLYEFGKTGTQFTTRLACVLLASWVLETERGDWDELPYWLKEIIPKRVEQEICNFDELCAKDVCDLYDEEKCFLSRARLRAKDADLVIANHAIVLSGIQFSGNSEEAVVGEETNPGATPVSPYSHALFPNEARFLIIDEAHHLEDDATSAWTRTISKLEVDLLIEQLYGRRGVKTLLENIATQRNSERLFGLVENFMAMEGNTRMACNSFFENVLPLLILESTYQGGTSYCTFKELGQSAEHKENLIKIMRDLEERYYAMNSALETFSKEATSEISQKILRIKAQKVYKIAKTFSILCDDDGSYVRYLERTGSIINVNAAPLSVAGRLRDEAYEGFFKSVILTSATLTTAKTFSFFAARSGTNLIARERVSYILLKSSFNYLKQVIFYVLRGTTHGGSSEDIKRKEVEERLKFLEKAIIASNGGALVLCSSHAQVKQLYDCLLEPLSKSNILLLMQTKGSSVNSVVREFTEDVNSVLIGTETLWQGIDVPGGSLRALFIF